MGKSRAPIGGFTLIEVLLALTILALAGTIVYSSLSTTLRSWSAGVELGRSRQAAGVALDRLSQQIKSAVPSTVKGEEGAVAAFDGGDDFVRFVTVLPVSGRPVAQVSYSVEEFEGVSQLVYRERPWPDKRFLEGGGKPWMEERVPEISGMKVIMRARGEEGTAGVGETQGREWVAGEEKDLPGEVEVTLLVPGEEEGVFRTLVSTPAPAGGRP